MFRIYLVQKGGWYEFGVDYPTRNAANSVASIYRCEYPHLRYIVRHVPETRRKSALVNQPNLST